MTGRTFLSRDSIAAALVLAAELGYAWKGYSPLVFFLWALGIASAAWALSRRDPPGALRPGADQSDWALLAAIGALASFLLTWKAGAYPRQINPDEVNFLGASRFLLHAVPPADLFGSYGGYFNFPVWLFMAPPLSARFLGMDVTLESLRIVSALWGALIVTAGFAFARLFLDRSQAVAAAFALMICHSFFGTSRMANMIQLPLVLEMASLGAFVLATRRRSLSLAFLSGAAAGLVFYNYASGMLILPVLGAFALWSWRPPRMPARYLAWLGLGLLISSLPHFIAAAKMTEAMPSYYRNQILLFPEGRELARQWAGTPAAPMLTILKDNFLAGIGAFNSGELDRAFNYQNPGHGLVDALGGILLWIGVGLALARKRGKPELKWLAIAFAGSLLAIALFTTKNPAYPRLLILLPPYAVLVGSAVIPLQARWRTAWAVSLLGLMALANARAYGDAMRENPGGIDMVGAYMRYVETHASPIKPVHFVVPQENAQYLGYSSMTWMVWMSLMVPPGTTVDIVHADKYFGGRAPASASGRGIYVFPPGWTTLPRLKPLAPGRYRVRALTPWDTLALEVD